MNATNAEEKARYESKASQLLTKIKEKAGEKDTGRAFSEGTISDNFRSARKTAYLKMDFALDKEGEIKQGQMARIAEFNIAELSAAKELYATNYDNNTNSEVDSMMGNRIKQMSRAANKGLQQYGRRIANGNIDNVVEKGKLIGATLSERGEDNRYTIESYSPIPIDDVRANAKKGVYKAGDVVIVQEKDNTGATITRIKVYTGLEQYSANHNMFIDAGEI